MMGCGVDSAVLRGWKEGHSITGWHGDQCSELVYMVSSRGSRAAGRGRAEVEGWCSGLDHGPGGSALPCIPAAGFLNLL